MLGAWRVPLAPPAPARIRACSPGEMASELSRRKPKPRKVGRAFCVEGMTCVGSQEQAAISRKWRAGGRARDEAGGAGRATRGKGGPSRPGVQTILKGVTEGF